MQSKAKMIIHKNKYVLKYYPLPAAVKREDGLLAEPPGALELQKLEGVYSEYVAGLNRTHSQSIQPKISTLEY